MVLVKSKNHVRSLWSSGVLLKEKPKKKISHVFFLFMISMEKKKGEYIAFYSKTFLFYVSMLTICFFFFLALIEALIVVQPKMAPVIAL